MVQMTGECSQTVKVSAADRLQGLVYLLSTNMNLSEICFTEEKLSLLLLLQLLNSEACFMGNLQLNCCVYKRGKSPG